MARRRIDPERIVDTALALAEEVGWGNLRLHAVAEALDLPLAELGGMFRDADAIADAWFHRGRLALTAPAPAGFGKRSPAHRAGIAMQRWFDALDAHRRLSAEMLGVKLYLGHPHHWVPLPFHLSRLIQWWREAAWLDSGGRRRQLEEIALTLLFLRTLWIWSRAADEDAAEAALQSLDRGLARLERQFAWWRE